MCSLQGKRRFLSLKVSLSTYVSAYKYNNKAYWESTHLEPSCVSKSVILIEKE
jgi:hypothetical protein